VIGIHNLHSSTAKLATSNLQFTIDVVHTPGPQVNRPDYITVVDLAFIVTAGI